MKKIIRLTESELVSLVKRTIMENNQDTNIEDLIMKYEGNAGFMKKMKELIGNGKKLTDNQISTVKSILKIKDDAPDQIIQHLVNYVGCNPQLIKLKEKYIRTKELSGGEYVSIPKYLKEDEKFKKDPNSMYQSLGSQTYLEMVRGSKKMLFDSVLRYATGTYKIDSPNKYWYEKNIRDLEYIEKIFGDVTKKNILFRDETSPMTLTQKINLLIQRCKKQDYIGILEIEGDDDQKEKWSILNKIDTNYTNWKNMLDERRANEPYTLISGTEQQIICDYFSQKPIEDIMHPSDVEELSSLLEVLSLNFKTMSLAEFDLLEAFLYETKSKLDTIKSRLKNTTEKGDDAENKFKFHLGFRDASLIKDFSEPGNIVDTNLGIDLIIEYKGEIYAVQIKSSKAGAENYPFVTKLGVKYLVIFPQGKRFGYFSNDNPNEAKDFDTDFLKIQ